MNAHTKYETYILTSKAQGQFITNCYSIFLCDIWVWKLQALDLFIFALQSDSKGFHFQYWTLSISLQSAVNEDKILKIWKFSYKFIDIILLCVAIELFGSYMRWSICSLISTILQNFKFHLSSRFEWSKNLFCILFSLVFFFCSTS